MKRLLSDAEKYTLKSESESKRLAKRSDCQIEAVSELRKEGSETPNAAISCGHYVARGTCDGCPLAGHWTCPLEMARDA